MIACPTNDDLQRLFTDTPLPDVTDHIAVCPDCRRRFDQLADEPFVGRARELHRRTPMPAANPVAGPASARPSHLPAIPGYDLLAEIGRGGMGVVYRGRHRATDRPVAVKLMAAPLVADGEWRERFGREARAMARVQHAHSVAVYDAGEADGQLYLAMEWVDGGSLAERLKVGPLSPRAAATLVRDAARAVAAAHAEGVVHRDLKPGNVLLANRRGEPKVGDFGLAQLGDEAASHTGVGLGTPAYMAPEQTGLARGTVGPAADVYGLGAIFYECLTGRVPFRGSTPMATLTQVATLDPPPPRVLQPTVPRDLETVCLKCLEKLSNRRYVSAAALAEDLDRWLDGKPVVARPVGPLTRVAKWAQRRPPMAALVAVCFLAAVAALAGWGRYTADMSAALERARREEQAKDAALVEERAANARAEKRLKQVAAGNQLLAGLFTDLNLKGAESGRQPLEVVLADRLVAASTSLTGDVVGDPASVADLQVQLAIALINLGFADKAVPLVQAARDTRTALRGPNHPDTINATVEMAIAQRTLGRTDLAIPLFEDAVGRYTAVYGPTHRVTIDTKNSLAVAYRLANDLRRALPLYQEVYRACQERLGQDNKLTLTAGNNLAICLRNLGRPAEAIPLLEAGLRGHAAILAPAHPTVLNDRNSLAAAYVAAGRVADAVPIQQETLRLSHEHLGGDHPQTVTAMVNLAVGYRMLGRNDEAIALIENAARAVESRQFTHERAELVMTRVANWLGEAGRSADAETWRKKWADAKAKR